MVGAFILFSSFETRAEARYETYGADGIEELLQFMRGADDYGLSDEAIYEFEVLFRTVGQERSMYFDDFDYLIDSIGGILSPARAAEGYIARSRLDTLSNINDAIFNIFLLRELSYGFLQDSDIMVTPFSIEFIESMFGDIHSFVYEFGSGEPGLDIRPVLKL